KEGERQREKATVSELGVVGTSDINRPQDGSDLDDHRNLSLLSEIYADWQICNPPITTIESMAKANNMSAILLSTRTFRKVPLRHACTLGTGTGNDTDTDTSTVTHDQNDKTFQKASTTATHLQDDQRDHLSGAKPEEFTEKGET
ncbi:hypothetical protein I317_07985, partial [Kwoniella heveanensis CBS 569]